MDWKEQPSILNHFLFINILRVENGQFLKPTVLRFEPRLIGPLWKSNFKDKNAKLNWHGDTPKWLQIDLKFGIYCPFGPKNWMKFETNNS